MQAAKSSPEMSAFMSILPVFLAAWPKMRPNRKRGFRRRSRHSRVGRLACRAAGNSGRRLSDIVISEFMDEAVVDDLRRDFSVHHDKGLVDRPEELADLLRDARALIVRNRTQVRGALLDAGARLEAIGRLGVGLDNIDVEACAFVSSADVLAGKWPRERLIGGEI